jgi:uncharacterized protein
MDYSVLIYVLLFLVAFLYASVGHGGASGYLAVMSLMGLNQGIMKPSSLILNLFVSLISFIGFYRAGHFRWRLFYPFALASIPMAYLGGTFNIPDPVYKKLLGAFLVICIGRLLFQRIGETTKTKPNNIYLSLLIGGIIGFLSGLLGIGGGIILSPLILLFSWGTLKETAAVSAFFIFMNSLSGLLGQIKKGNLPTEDFIFYAVFFCVIGGVLGTYYGTKRFNNTWLKYILALGLSIAVIKLFLA